MNCGATGTFGNITTSGNTTLGGTLSVAGNYGAWARFTLYGTSYPASVVSALTWSTSFTSSNITRTANSSSFAVSQAGVYKFDAQVTFQTGQTAIFILALQRSTNSGSAWTTYNATYSLNASTVVVNFLTLSSLVQANAGDWFQYTISNPIASALLISSSGYTFQSVCRVG